MSSRDFPPESNQIERSKAKEEEDTVYVEPRPQSDSCDSPNFRDVKPGCCAVEAECLEALPTTLMGAIATRVRSSAESRVVQPLWVACFTGGTTIEPSC